MPNQTSGKSKTQDVNDISLITFYAIIDLVQ